MFRSERFELSNHGFYWLSPTPDVPSSTGFTDGQQLPRLVAWAELLDERSRRRLYFASTHFDATSPSQEKSAPLVVERTAPHAADLPVVVVGDFNSKPDDPAFQTLVGGSGEPGGVRFVDSQAIADTWRIDMNQDPAPEYDLGERIDHIFLAGGGVTWKVSEWVVDLHLYGPNERYPSDHRAMVARLDYEPPPASAE